MIRSFDEKMIGLTDVLAKIAERGTKLDQIDQAIADIRKLCHSRKRNRSTRQLRLPLVPKPSKKLKRSA
jgi:hypothetical protein